MLPAPLGDPTGRRRPPGRYDAPSRIVPRALALTLSALFLAFLVALAWLMYQRFSADTVPSRVVTWSVLPDDSVELLAEVTPPGDSLVWCLVRSRNGAGEEIGRQWVPVSGDGGRTVDVRHVLPTSDRPVTGEMPRCQEQAPPAGEPTAPPSGDESP